MAERVGRLYRGYYISAAARLVPAGDAPRGRSHYVGSVSLAELGLTIRTG